MSRLNEFLSAALKLLVIAIIIIGIIFFCISIYANVTEDNPGSAYPKLPDTKKAPYMVVLKTTGELYLTDNYEVISNGCYLLHGFYDGTDGKWRYRDSDITLNEKYFGEITIVKR